ncbi:hypothetical protein H4219_004783 [Mycoemilia scoparia]|uniref:tRNA (guanine-N(7)-)-methyltransferase non-catalytic subunit TRM82 n=1 Tax=Mycoemilia scoparia TaxID=417184 RepID=A0A9W8A019_9FUNG|nr:hypothetical protein H4219_004783 [Mycoemilia scoparia]
MAAAIPFTQLAASVSNPNLNESNDGSGLVVLVSGHHFHIIKVEQPSSSSSSLGAASLLATTFDPKDFESKIADTTTISLSSAVVTYLNDDKNKINEKDGEIISTRFSRDSKLLAICTKNKGLYIYSSSFSSSSNSSITDGDERSEEVTPKNHWKLAAKTWTPKRINSVIFDSVSENVIVGDKFGDAYKFRLEIDSPIHTTTIHEQSQQQQQQQQQQQLKENDKSDPATTPDDGSFGISKPEILLGHVSILTDLEFSWNTTTNGEKIGCYIVSADRDEKIRISRYPNAYNIEGYCLGHTAFVTTVCAPSFAATRLLSGAGDATVKVWQMPSPTKQVQSLDFKNIVDAWYGLQNVPNQDEIAILKITGTSGGNDDKLVAVLVEYVPVVFIFGWDEAQNILTSTPISTIRLNNDDNSAEEKKDETTIIPRDVEWDLVGNLWVSFDDKIRVYGKSTNEATEANIEWVENNQIEQFVSESSPKYSSVFEWGRKILGRKPTAAGNDDKKDGNGNDEMDQDSD